MVITVDIDNFSIMKTLVDQGSSVDIPYWKTFKKIRIPESEMQSYDDQIVDFLGERVDTRGYGQVDLNDQDTILVMEANTSYNILLGRMSLNHLWAIISTLHLDMKFPSIYGDILIVHMNQKVAQECYVANLRVEPTSGDMARMGRGCSQERRSPREERKTLRKEPKTLRQEHTVTLVELDPWINEARLKPGNELRPIPLQDEERTMILGTSLSTMQS